MGFLIFRLQLKLKKFYFKKLLLFNNLVFPYLDVITNILIYFLKVNQEVEKLMKKNFYTPNIFSNYIIF